MAKTIAPTAQMQKQLSQHKQYKIIKPDYSTVFTSPNPETIPAFSPDVELLPNGNILVICESGVYPNNQLHTFISSNKGVSWQQAATSTLTHARCLTTPTGVYVIGHRGDLGIIRSTNNAQTFSEITYLTQGQSWHAAPTNYITAHGRIYLALEREVPHTPQERWPVAFLAPTVLSAPLDANLTDPSVWTFSNSDLIFDDHCKEFPDLAMPFFPLGPLIEHNGQEDRYNAPIGYLETNIAQIKDPNHIWYDTSGMTFHLILRAHTGGLPNIGCVLKAIQKTDGSIEVTWEKSPSGQRCLFLPIPGGHLKFDITYDPQTQRYFMAANISNDSTTKPALVESGRYNLPVNERRYLGLFISRNLVDWQFLQMIAAGTDARESRNYPSFTIQDQDLIVASRSGDKQSCCAHNSNTITFHRIQNFRSLLKPWH